MLPFYISHKTVQAAEIAVVEAPSNGSAETLLLFKDAALAPAIVDAAFVAKHAPKAGDFFIIYADGYQSISPAAAFEAGYTLVPEGQGFAVLVGTPEEIAVEEEPVAAPVAVAAPAVIQVPDAAPVAAEPEATPTPEEAPIVYAPEAEVTPAPEEAPVAEVAPEAPTTPLA